MKRVRRAVDFLWAVFFWEVRDSRSFIIIHDKVWSATAAPRVATKKRKQRAQKTSPSKKGGGVGVAITTNYWGSFCISRAAHSTVCLTRPGLGVEKRDSKAIIKIKDKSVRRISTSLKALPSASPAARANRFNVGQTTFTFRNPQSTIRWAKSQWRVAMKYYRDHSTWELRKRKRCPVLFSLDATLSLISGISMPHLHKQWHSFFLLQKCFLWTL